MLLPLNGKISNLTFINSKVGFALSNNVILKYCNDNWQIFKHQPPLKEISILRVISENSILVIGSLESFSSKIFLYNGKFWEEIKHPISNQINDISDIKRDTVYFGGDRELLKYSNNKWKFIEHPPSPYPIKEISILDNSLFVLMDNRELFVCREKKWSKVHSNEKIFQIINDKKNIYCRGNKKLWKLGNLRLELLHNSKYPLVKTLIYKDRFYSILSNNSLSVLENSKEIIEKFSEEISDLNITISGDIYIITTDGKLICKKENKQKTIEKYKLSFSEQKPISIYKDLFDEYGVAIDDLNNDGRLDIYAVCITEANRVYINYTEEPNKLSFKEESSQRKITGITEDVPNKLLQSREFYLGIGCADIDNDNAKDLYLCNLLGTNKLFLNNGDGYFRNVSDDDRGIGVLTRSNSASFADVDNDGDLDLFVTNEYSSNKLYMNNGYGYFIDVTDNAGLTTKFGGMSATFSDIDNDGDQDLFVTNWGTYNLLYENIFSEGKIKFRNISETSGIKGKYYSKSNGVTFADINNDTYQDIFVTNRRSSNELYLNNKNKTFTNVTQNFLGNDSLFSYGAAIADFDNDTFLDIYLANIGKNKFYINLAGKGFQEISKEIGLDIDGYSTGVATGDLDNDGDIDIYSASYIDEGSKIFVNKWDEKNFLKVKIIPSESNLDGVGTKLFLFNDKDKMIGYREISSGSGYASHNSGIVHFGTGNEKLLTLRVYFPKSRIERVYKNIEKGKLIEVFETEGYFLNIYNKTNRFIRGLYLNKVHRFESIKAMILLLIVLTFSYYSKIKKIRIFTTVILHIINVILFIYISFLLNNKGVWLSFILPITFSIFYYLIFYFYYSKFVVLKEANIEKKMIRERIARDLHDDLASTLSSAAIYSELLDTKIKDIANGKKITAKLKELIYSASNAVSDIVWIVKPGKETFLQVIDKIQNMIVENCMFMNIEVKFNICKIENDFPITEQMKRNIYLIFKEALNNSLKYSKTKKISFEISKKEAIEIKLVDKGIGFKINKENNVGNGISNMKRRADEIDADLVIQSKIKNGTEIKLLIKMTQTGH